MLSAWTCFSGLDKKPFFDQKKKKDKKLYFNKFTGGAIINENMSKKELAEELQRPLIKKFNKRIIHSFVVDYIWSAGVTDTQLISKFSKEIRFLLCVIYIFNKYKWIIPLEDKKGIKTNNAFQKFSKESNCKPNKYE